jgi:signal transduction histidine kinase
MVSNITHELKTPLAIIHSYAEGLQSGIAEEKKEKYLSTILEEAERMDGMVLEMLDHSRLESGKVRLATDHFSLYQLTASIAEKLTPAMEERQLKLSWGFSNDCMLTADESRMAQVVTNLMTNAVRYTPEGGSIWLRVFADAKDATFQIENEGTHLPEEIREKIFETFYRADDSRTGKGTGLGLPIAKSIVELHRGTIKVQNTYTNGKPTILFTVTIPLK